MPEASICVDARKNLASIMDAVCDSHEPVIITRRQAGAVVLMSLEDYNSILETGYLLNSSKNADRLRASVRSVKTGSPEARALPDD